MKKIRLLIADDHEIVRMGLSALLDSEPDIEVVGEAVDGDEAVRKALQLKPDVVVMDLMMPGTDGAAATALIRARLPDVRVLILTTSGSADHIRSALDAGASGVALKSAANSKLPPAIRAIAAGQLSIAPEVEQMFAEDPPAAELTDRQREILSAVVRGLTNPEIGTALGISPNSVKWHLKEIFARIGAANRSEAVAIALQRHLLRG